MKNIKLVNASAGSGKTHKLKEELALALTAKGKNKIRPDAVIATTFTKKAARELRERVRVGLLEEGMSKEANLLMNSLIGTVHSICTEMLTKFSYELGLMPSLEVLPEEDEDTLFGEAISNVLNEDLVNRMNQLSYMLGFEDGYEIKEWRAELKNILQLARSNGMGASKLRESADYSFKTYLQNLPPKGKKSKTQIERELSKQINIAKEKFEKNDLMGLKYVKDTSQFFDRFASSTIDNNWNKWAQLSKVHEKGKNESFQAIVAPIVNLANGPLATPEFRNDIKEYLSTIFDIAIKAMEDYQNFKEDRGLIDYGDMEAFMLQALDNENVWKRISEEYEFLMVDEFQDTNPMQMAIFLKLAQLVKRVIWVGDPKQSIFDFRGTDPKLMEEVLKKVPSNNVETLKNSWRSRPELIDLSNNIFCKLFDGKLGEGQIKLTPVRKSNKKLATPVEVWNLVDAKAEQGRTRKEHKLQTIAENIAEIISEKRKVAIGRDDNFREIKGSDIAVLCRTNNDCMQMADALKSVGIEVAIARSKLLYTPEGILLHACLKYLNNPIDSLARFELLLMSDTNPKVESILDKRLEWINKGKPTKEWGKDNIFIKWLDNFREISVESTPFEITRNILTSSPFIEQIELWGKADQRQANIEMFLVKSKNYEDQCQRLNHTCTLSGLLLWLSKQGEDLEQGEDYGEEAIHISTYHSSKGLEWPFVIMTGLEKERRPRIFNMEAISQKDKININAPLEDRVIRYWINPFTSDNVEGLEKFEESNIGKECIEKSYNEMTRLFYVGLTRARDYVIFAHLNKKDGLNWPNELMQLKNEKFELPTKEGLQSTTWMKDKIKVRKFKTAGLVNEYKKPEKVSVYKKAADKKEYSPFKISPSVAKEIKVNLKVGDITNYGKGFPVVGRVDDNADFGNCIHDIMCLGTGITMKQVENILKNHQMNQYANAKDVLEGIKQFYTLIQKKWSRSNGYQTFYELPVHVLEGGQFFSGICDMVLETNDGLVLIDHKTYHGTDSGLKKKSKEFLLQFELYRQMLEKASKKKVLKMFINYISKGKLIEML